MCERENKEHTLTTVFIQFTSRAQVDLKFNGSEFPKETLSYWLKSSIYSNPIGTSFTLGFLPEYWG